MEKHADIITLGEMLIDLTQKGSDENGNGEFTAYPGGAPANVAVAAARLGAGAAFIGKVGDDAFGRSLADTLKKEKVDTSGLYASKEVPTTLAIVSVDASGERDFSFYRDPGADTQLTEEEAVRAVKQNESAKIFHVGSLSMTTSPAREACEKAVKYAKGKGMLISYDPNYRAALWDSEERAVKMMKALMPYTDILKVSDEELPRLLGLEPSEAEQALRQASAAGNLPSVRQAALRSKAIESVMAGCSCTYNHETPREAAARNREMLKQQSFIGQTNEDPETSESSAHPHLKLV